MAMENNNDDDDDNDANDNIDDVDDDDDDDWRWAGSGVECIFFRDNMVEDMGARLTARPEREHTSSGTRRAEQDYDD
jgi:hypothetical protein